MRKIIGVCTEYLYMKKLNDAAEANKQDKYNYSKTCLLITLCQLNKPLHMFLMLKRAKVATKNAKNFISCVGVLFKMLALEKDLTEFDDLGFDRLLGEYNTLKDRNNEKDYPFNMKDIEKKPAREVIDAVNLEVIESNTKKIVCPLCCASYRDGMVGKVCVICGLCVLGKETVGFKLNAIDN